MSRRLWTEDDVKVLKEQIELGTMHKDIAEILDRSYRAVGEKARKLKISKNKKWTEEDIEILIMLVNEGLPYKDIAEVVDRSIKAIEFKVFKLGIGRKNWTKNEEEVLRKEIKVGTMHKDIGLLLGRSTSAIKAKTNNLELKSNRIKTNEKYDAELRIKNPDTIRIEEYKGANTKILHKCLICGTEYLCAPNHKLEGHGHCGRQLNGIPKDKPGIAYLIHFPNEKLYKIGITSRTVKKRMKDIGIKDYEVILERHFDKGINAMELEAEWLSNIQYLKVNTGLLNSGNTETFRLENK